MISAAKIKWVKSLHQKKGRREEGLFIAEGEKIVNELLQSNWEITDIFATEQWHHPSAASGKFNFGHISNRDLERISALTTPNNVLAVVKIPRAELPVINKENPFCLLLDNIQDPGNLGTIIRTADWFGIHEIVCSPDTADVYNPKVIQATMGSFIRTRVAYSPAPDFLKTLPDDMPVMGALLDGENIFNATLPKKGVLIIGNESKGISVPLMNSISHRLFIPRGNPDINLPESLNASVAAAIIMARLTG